MLDQRFPRPFVSLLHTRNHFRLFLPAQRFGKRAPLRQIAQQKKRIVNEEHQ